eukprot:7244396-Prymnesium_polylepis.2
MGRRFHERNSHCRVQSLLRKHQALGTSTPGSDSGRPQGGQQNDTTQAIPSRQLARHNRHHAVGTPSTPPVPRVAAVCTSGTDCISAESRSPRLR